LPLGEADKAEDADEMGDVEDVADPDGPFSKAVSAS